MALMKNNNRRSFFPLLLTAVGAACLLPRKAVGKALGIDRDSIAQKTAPDADARAVAALIKKAPHTVAYNPARGRGTTAL